MSTINTQQELLVSGAAGNVQLQNSINNWLDALHGGAKNVLTAEPSSPSEGDLHILTGTPSGTNWGSDTGAVDNALALYINSAWEYVSPPLSKEGICLWVHDESNLRAWDGSSWTEFSTKDIQSTGGPAIILINRTDGAILSLAAGSIASNFRYDNANDFKIQNQPRADLEAKNGSNLVDVVTVGATSPSNSLTIDGSGNIGVNVAKGSAVAKLDVDGNVRTGRTTITATGPTDNLDVSEVNNVFIDASSNSVTIGGFVGGVGGQFLDIVIIGIGSGNTVTIEHNEGHGNQNIFLNGKADSAITNDYGGWRLICQGSSNWYEVKS